MVTSLVTDVSLALFEELIALFIIVSRKDVPESFLTWGSIQDRGHCVFWLFFSC